MNDCVLIVSRSGTWSILRLRFLRSASTVSRYKMPTPSSLCTAAFTASETSHSTAMFGLYPCLKSALKVVLRRLATRGISNSSSRLIFFSDEWALGESKRHNFHFLVRLVGDLIKVRSVIDESNLHFSI